MVHNRVKDDCIIFQLHLILFLFCSQLCKRNDHDCLGLMQFLFYKSSSKHVLRSELGQLDTGTEREKIQTNI